MEIHPFDGMPEFIPEDATEEMLCRLIAENIVRLHGSKLQWVANLLLQIANHIDEERYNYDSPLE